MMGVLVGLTGLGFLQAVVEVRWAPPEYACRFCARGTLAGSEHAAGDKVSEQQITHQKPHTLTHPPPLYSLRSGAR